jgi:Zn-dependent metalloprotease
VNLGGIMNTLSKIIVLLFCFASVALGYAPVDNSQHEILLNETQDYVVRGNQHISKMTGKPTLLFNLGYDVQPGTPLEMAIQYLSENAELLGIDSKLLTIQHTSTRETQAGYRVRFEQVVNNSPVYKSDITISLNRNSQIVFVTNGYRQIPSNLDYSVSISENAALSIAKSHLGITSDCKHEVVERIIYSNFLNNKVAQKVELSGFSEFSGSWEILVDAQTGEIFRAEDKNCYATGNIFNPDPTTQRSTPYGDTGFLDNFDADNDTLTSCLLQVDLGELTQVDNMYELTNSYAKIIDYEGPFTGLHHQESDSFLYSRSDDIFEAVNCFYFISNSMQYLNDSLGYEAMPYQYDEGMHYDPRGLDDGQNAYYNPFDGVIVFGNPEEYVDACEGSSVVLHELGHGIHDWITNGGGSQVEGLSEGCGDYWSQSDARSHGHISPEHEMYDWYGVWGLMPIHDRIYLRVTNYSGHYPEDLDGEVHIDGQMWSSSLMSIYDEIGKEATDKLFIEALSMTDMNSGQVEAARAFIQADTDLYDGVHIDVIAHHFIERGYFEGPISVFFSADQPSGSARTVQFNDQSLGYPEDIITWAWDFNEDGETDSELQNPTWDYSETGIFDVTLTVFTESSESSFTFADYISVNGGTLVFEGEVNVQDYSGEYIYDFLTSNNADSVYYSSHLPATLLGYDNVFLSFGNILWDEEIGHIAGTTVDEPIHNIINEYLQSGGNIYIEAGPIFTFLEFYNFELYQSTLTSYGISGCDPRFSEQPITNLVGVDGSIFDGVSFSSSSQVSNNFVERYTPLPSASITFNEGSVGNVGIMNENNFDGKTICFSYALSCLTDQEVPNTRDEVMRRMCEFFGITVTSGIDASSELVPNSFALHGNYPNPFNPETTISFDVPFASSVSIIVYDVLGREVTTLLKPHCGMEWANPLF